MKTKILTIAFVLTGLAATAQTNSRDQFVKQQAYNEMMRVVRQMEVLESNLSALSDRVSRLERSGENNALRSEIEALRAEVRHLKTEMASQRTQIVSDLLGRINKAQARDAASASTTKPASNDSNCEQYVVQRGDTLSLISQAFGTTVKRLKELNGLKSDNLRVGQKLLVPAQSRR
jgi:LysM repeat protein